MSVPALATNNPFRSRSESMTAKGLAAKPSGLKIDTAQIVIAVTKATPESFPLPPPPPPAQLAPSRDGARPQNAVAVRPTYGGPNGGSRTPHGLPEYVPGNPEGSQRVSWAPSLRSEAGSPPPAGKARFSDPWAASRVASPVPTPLRNAEQPPPDLSTPEELLDLWALADGQGDAALAPSYYLGLQWQDFSFCLRRVVLLT